MFGLNALLEYMTALLEYFIIVLNIHIFSMITALLSRSAKYSGAKVPLSKLHLFSCIKKWSQNFHDNFLNIYPEKLNLF